jgi:uncharacterized membrane protein YjgN (DUF898 family)
MGQTQDGMAVGPDGTASLMTYDGKAAKLFGMGLTISLLTLLTLGFYRFWGKTKVRRYLCSRMSILGDRFEYTGTGKELFLGFLIALTVLIPLGAASYGIEIFLTGKSGATQGIVITLQYAVILFLIGYATFRARRYRLSRTVLRGIRFWQTGSNVGYALRMMGYLVLTMCTLGIARPIGDAALYRYLMRHTWFGSQQFEFDGRAGEMMGKWLLAFVLFPFTLGLSLIWYAAFAMRYKLAHTRYQGVTFTMPVTFGNLFRIYFPYFLVLLVLLGIFYGAVFATIMPTLIENPPTDPQGWIAENAVMVYGVSIAAAFVVFGLIAPVLQLVLLTHRFLKLVAERLAINGAVNLDAIMQSAAARPNSGEGLADALDIGGGLEVGI